MSDDNIYSKATEDNDTLDEIIEESPEQKRAKRKKTIVSIISLIIYTIIMACIFGGLYLARKHH